MVFLWIGQAKYREFLVMEPKASDGIFANQENSISIRLVINSEHVLWRPMTHRLIQCKKMGNV